MIDFRENCRIGGRAFLQTAIIIDNEASLGTQPVAQTRKAARVSGSILTRSGNAREFHEHPDEAVLPGPPPGETAPNMEAAHSAREPEDFLAGALDAKALTDAFSRVDVICGVYKPTSGEELLEPFAAAAAHADIVIVDWILEGQSSRAAKDIVRRILSRDASENGRLRLICVYTTQPDLPALAEELFLELDAVPLLHSSFKLDGPNALIEGASTRICFYGKSDDTSTDSPGVPVADLPSKLIEQFAALTEGVLSSFAVTAIAAVRRSVHNIVAIFDRSLDGAFAAHRGSIPHPEEAMEFARSLVAAEIANVVSMDGSSARAVSGSLMQGWVEHIANQGRRFIANNVEIPKELMSEVMVHGSELLTNSFDRQRLVAEPGQVSRARAIKPDTLVNTFYDSAEVASSACKRFSRLSSFRRERHGGLRLLEGWAPTLTLGSVVRIRRQQSQATPTEPDELTADYYVCTQPRCDSVRLDGIVTFPFQAAPYSADKFNLVTSPAPGANDCVHITSKPRDSVNLRFRPDETTQTVQARRGDDGEYIFHDVQGRAFVWIGDLKELNAQRYASETASSTHRVGLPEFEWLRSKTRSR